MPTATDGRASAFGAGIRVARRLRVARRRTLRQLVALAASPFAASSFAASSGQASSERALFAATWGEGDGYFAGVLATTPGGVTTVHREAVPTRAHGIVMEPHGTLLVASRRPGDWLMRFDPRKQAATAWCWSDGDFGFNGHVIASRDGRRLFSTETSLETGAGSIGVRDAATFELLARWPTAGIDPHELVLGADGSLWVANGGIDTRPETGRIKHHLERMDSSLVRFDAASGRITGQWRLEDRRLGLRHLAFADDGTLGIALQAEHDDPEAKRAAPILAIWQARRGLRAVPLPEGIRLSGYGGSIARVAAGLAVSCPRDDQVTHWRLAAGEAAWQPPLILAEACALSQGWCGGVGAVVHADPAAAATSARWPLPAAIRLDNHWVMTGVQRSDAQTSDARTSDRLTAPDATIPA